ncbi:hypothetical protein [Faecalibaculum rodentium]|uniref:hypothetical protein n=1 Tax=Faecalibaculum rodentium TaxID=1702221 RepID=UPI003F66F206
MRLAQQTEKTGQVLPQESADPAAISAFLRLAQQTEKTGQVLPQESADPAAISAFCIFPDHHFPVTVVVFDTKKGT